MVNDNLHWLLEYKDSYERFENALNLYSSNGDLTNIVDDLRKSLEFLLHVIFKNRLPLEKQRKNIKDFLDKRNINKEIIDTVRRFIEFFGTYNNRYAKHGNRVYKEETEFLLYQTGVFLKLFITLSKVEV